MLFTFIPPARLTAAPRCSPAAAIYACDVICVCMCVCGAVTKWLRSSFYISQETLSGKKRELFFLEKNDGFLHM